MSFVSDEFRGIRDEDLRIAGSAFILPHIVGAALRGRPSVDYPDLLFQMRGGHGGPPYNFYNGTLTVFRISFNAASASSVRRSDDENRELTVIRCANTGTSSRFMSSGM